MLSSREVAVSFLPLETSCSGYFLMFLGPLIDALLFDHVLWVLALVVSRSSIGRHCSIREGKLGVNCDTRASKDSDPRLRGTPTNRASDGSQLQPKAQTDRQDCDF